MNIIRFHSFYPWHTSESYKHLMNDTTDKDLLDDVRKLNSFDLYSKEDTDFKLTYKIKNYYAELLSFYFPKPLSW